MTESAASKVAGLVMRIAGARWYLPVESVVEVLRDPVVARVPGAPATVAGLVNHRGHVLTVVDPIRALELPGQGSSGRDVVVVASAGRRFAVAVDAVIELVPEARTGLATLDLERVRLAVFG